MSATSSVTTVQATKLPSIQISDKVLNERLAKLQGADWDSDDSEEEIEQSEGSKLEEEFVSLVTKNKDEQKQQETQSSDQVLVAEKKTTFKSSKKSADDKSIKTDESKVLYLGHIPHGFYEDQMIGFFSQFGELKHLRLSRNRKTGQSKHFAFIEFEDAEVTSVVAKTMNGYRLFDHTLQCQVLKASQIHPKLFQRNNAVSTTSSSNSSSSIASKFHVVPWKQIARDEHNQDKSHAQQQKRLTKLVKKENAKRQRLTQLGIDFDFDGYSKRVQPPSKHIKYSDEEEGSVASTSVGGN